MGGTLCSSCISGGTTSVPSPPPATSQGPIGSLRQSKSTAGQNLSETNNNDNNSNNDTTITSNAISTATTTVMGNTMKKATLAQQVSMALKTVQRLGINLLAIDFDQTILNIHTGGQWKGNARELARHVRPEFQEIFHQVQQLDNLDICIVTFSPQVELIRQVVEEGTTWNLAENDHTASKRFPLVIRGGDQSWTYVGAGSVKGKQPHMASAVEELEGEHERNITKQTTLLIDDDSNNVRCALRDGVRAIWFNPRRPQDLLPDIIRLV